MSMKKDRIDKILQYVINGTCSVLFETNENTYIYCPTLFFKIADILDYGNKDLNTMGTVKTTNNYIFSSYIDDDTSVGDIILAPVFLGSKFNNIIKLPFGYISLHKLQSLRGIKLNIGDLDETYDKRVKLELDLSTLKLNSDYNNNIIKLPIADNNFRLIKKEFIPYMLIIDKSKYKSKIYTESDILDEKMVDKEEANKIYDDLITIREDEKVKYSKTSNGNDNENSKSKKVKDRATSEPKIYLYDIDEKKFFHVGQFIIRPGIEKSALKELNLSFIDYANETIDLALINKNVNTDNCFYRRYIVLPSQIHFERYPNGNRKRVDVYRRLFKSTHKPMDNVVYYKDMTECSYDAFEVFRKINEESEDEL